MFVTFSLVLRRLWFLKEQKEYNMNGSLQMLYFQVLQGVFAIYL